MAAPESVVQAVDRIIADFNARKLDLPAGFFDRKTQFIVNGTPFETLLSPNPSDPLVLMLARGPAGYRFTVKALQHAIPNVSAERGDIVMASATVASTEEVSANFQLWLSGLLRGSGEPANVLVDIRLRLTPGGVVRVAEAAIEGPQLERISQARHLP